jgi:acyl-CoA thioesterase-1
LASIAINITLLLIAMNQHLNRRCLLATLLLCAALLWQVPFALASQPVILVFGDSLSAEYGLKRGTGWVSLLQDRLKEQGFPHRIVNASISGETTAGGAARLSGVLKKHQPDLVILELGGNDGLRGLPIAQTRTNLRNMATLANKNGAQTLIVGIRVPPNYGPDYARQFDRLFESVAQELKVPVVPFLLEGIAENPQMFQADGIHPNEKAQPRMLNHVWSELVSSKLLERSASRSVSARQ